MAEHDIQNDIRMTLSELGYCVFRINVGKFKMPDGRWFDVGVPKGFSDLFAVKDGRAYFIEVKDKNGRVRADQEHFLKTMRERYGCVAGIARSTDDALRLCGEKGENA